MLGRRRFAFLIPVALTALMPGLAAQGAFSAPILLREAAVVRVQDVATAGSYVAVGWREGENPGELWVKVSPDKGATFRRKFAVAGVGSAGLSLAICGDRVWAVSAARFSGDGSGDRDLLVSHRRTTGGDAGQAFLTQPAADHAVSRPQVACVGSRLLAIAWLDRAAGETRAFLLLRDLASLRTAATDERYDLGPARGDGGISVAATDTAVHVAWTRSTREDLWYRRFRIGDQRDPVVSPVKAVRMATADARLPQLAVRGQRVVLAYSDDGQLAARLSADTGATFADPVTLIGVGNVEVPSQATSAAVRGSRIVIEALRRPPRGAGVTAAADERVPYRLESDDAGATWSQVRQGNRGSRVGVLRAVSGGDSLLLEAWHDSGTVDRLRFQREIP